MARPSLTLAGDDLDRSVVRPWHGAGPRLRRSASGRGRP